MRPKKRTNNYNQILNKTKEQLVLNRLVTLTGTIISALGHIILKQRRLWRVLRTSKLFTVAGQRSNIKRKGECPLTIILLPNRDKKNSS
jgi:hypothetical protein